MTKILYVHGNDDYAASLFEDWVPKEKWGTLWQTANAERAKVYDYDFETEAFDGDEQRETETVRLEALSFPDIPQEFLDFVKDKVQDYDDSKHKNFYVINDI